MHQVDGLGSGNGESSTASLGLEAEETPLLPDEECHSSKPNMLPDDAPAVVMEGEEAVLIRILPGLLIRLLFGQAPNNYALPGD